MSFTMACAVAALSASSMGWPSSLTVQVALMTVPGVPVIVAMLLPQAGLS
jgi:hypothetical protein